MVLGIRQKFIVLCGLVGALLAVVSLLGYFMAYRALDASIKGEITASMASEQRDLAGWVKEHVRISEDLANHAADLDAAAAGGHPSHKLFAPSKDEMLLGLTLARDDSTVVSWPSGDITGKLDPHTRSWYNDAKAAGHTIYTDPYKDAITGKLCMSIATPYYDANGAFAGATCEDVSLESLEQYAGSIHYKGEGVGAIIGQDGVIVAAADSSMTGKSVSEYASLQPHFSEMQNNKSGYFVADVAGEKTIIAYDTVAGPNWIMALAVPESTVFASMTSMKWMFLIVTLVGLVLVLLVTRQFALRIVTPVRTLQAQAGELAKGNLRIDDCAVTSQDELGQLAHSFNEMTASLRQLLQNVSKTTEQVASASEELTANSDQSAQASQSVAQTIVDVANSMEEQLRGVDGVKQHVDQVYTQVGAMTDKAKVITQRSAETAEAAAKGQQLMQGSVDQMAEIEQSVNATSAVMDKLGANSQEIGTIVETISGIAEQTNLLALNAAIEAARAGEQGRGFSVVADEVRKLAEASQQAAGEITARIETIQHDTEQALASMQQGTERVKSGMASIREVGTEFGDIMTQIGQTKDDMLGISEAVQKLADSTQEIVQVVDNIDTISRKTSENTQTISAAAEQQGASTEEIAAASRSLAGLAEELQTAAKKFKV